MLHNAFELFIKGFRTVIAACYGVFRAADFIHDCDLGKPKGRRIFYNNAALFIERKISLRCIIGARLDFEKDSLRT